MADMAPVTDQIRERLGDFSPAERKVARALLSGTPTVGLDSSAKLAEWAGVSGPTVSRFVNRLGFATFAEFKGRLRLEVDARVTSPVDLYRARHGAPGSAEGRDGVEGAAGTGGADGTRDSLRAIHDALGATLRSVAPEDIRAGAALLGDRKRRVVAVGGWFSQFLASYLVALLQRVRPGCQLVEQSSRGWTAALADADRHTVAVVFDYRRYEADTLAFAQAARERGARVVLFTDRWLSPVADLAELVFPVDISSAGIETLAPAMAVVETVVTQILDADTQHARARFESFNGIADQVVAGWPAPRAGESP